MTKKKGQEEIIGFVLIVVIVAVVFLVFLGVSIRKGGEPVSLESVDVYHFLESSMEYTTDCAIRFDLDYATLGDLFGECYSGNKCLNGLGACESLNETLKEIFEISWQVGPQSPFIAYRFDSVYTDESSEDLVISLNNGNCSGNVQGASYVRPSFPGKIVSTFELCF